MTTENTVTIPLEEYFDLRQKAEMNTYLMGEFRRYDERFNRYDDMLFRLEDEIRGLKHGN